MAHLCVHSTYYRQLTSSRVHYVLIIMKWGHIHQNINLLTLSLRQKLKLLLMELLILIGGWCSPER